MNIGDVHNRRGELVEALRHYQRALAIVEQEGERRIHAILLNAVGVIYTKQGNYQAALAALHQAEEINEEAKDREELLKCYANLGTTYEQIGRPIRAQTYYNLAFHLAKDIQYPTAEATALMGLGNLCWTQNDLVQALANYQQAEKIFRTVENPDGLLICLRKIGGELMSTRAFEQAREYLEVTLLFFHILLLPHSNISESVGSDRFQTHMELLKCVIRERR